MNADLISVHPRSSAARTQTKDHSVVAAIRASPLQSAVSER